MRNGRRIALIVPALNEAENLPDVLARVPNWVDRICVVDNGSTDATADVARRSGAQVLVENRRGYGWACSRGVAACVDFDVLLFADADGSDDLSTAHVLVDLVATDQADLAMGNRMAGLAEPGALSWPQRWGNALACRIMRWRFGLFFEDLGPLRAASPDTLTALDQRQMTYGWTVEMQLRLRIRGGRVIEVPVRYFARRAGRSKVSRSLSGIGRAGYHIIRTILAEPRP